MCLRYISALAERCFHTILPEEPACMITGMDYLSTPSPQMESRGRDYISWGYLITTQDNPFYRPCHPERNRGVWPRLNGAPFAVPDVSTALRSARHDSGGRSTKISSTQSRRGNNSGFHRTTLTLRASGVWEGQADGGVGPKPSRLLGECACAAVMLRLSLRRDYWGRGSWRERMASPRGLYPRGLVGRHHRSLIFPPQPVNCRLSPVAEVVS